MKDLHN